jgi:hypothetical protein
MRTIMFTALPVALLACAAQAQQRVPIDSVWSGTKCTQTGALDTFKGETASTDLAVRIMMASRAHDVRWVPFGTSVKLRPGKNRVTVQLDQQNKVVSAACG